MRRRNATRKGRQMMERANEMARLLGRMGGQALFRWRRGGAARVAEWAFADRLTDEARHDAATRPPLRARLIAEHDGNTPRKARVAASLKGGGAIRLARLKRF